MIRIGFDFDGVLAYNPARVARFPIAYFKKKFVKQRKLKFWYPKERWQKVLWQLAHKTSILPAPGYNKLIGLLNEGKVEGYVITARYSFLREDFAAWFAKHDPGQLFKGYYLNRRDEQPHLFKERMIKELKLDYFVEDNWDIVNYLNQKSKRPKDQHIKDAEQSVPRQNSKSNQANPLPITHNSLPITEVHWIYNVLDRRIDYPHKHPHLSAFISSLKT